MVIFGIGVIERSVSVRGCWCVCGCGDWRTVVVGVVVVVGSVVVVVLLVVVSGAVKDLTS